MLFKEALNSKGDRPFSRGKMLIQRITVGLFQIIQDQTGVRNHAIAVLNVGQLLFGAFRTSTRCAT